MRRSGPGPTVTSTPWATVWSAVGLAPGGPAAWASCRFVCFVNFSISWQRHCCNWSLSFLCNPINCLSRGGEGTVSYFSFNFLNMDVGRLPGLLIRLPAWGRRTVAQWDHRDTFRSGNSRESGDRCDFTLRSVISHMDHGVGFGLACLPLSGWSRWTPLPGWWHRPGSIPGSRSWPGSRIGQTFGHGPASRSSQTSRSWIKPPSRSGPTGCVGSRIGPWVSEWRGPPPPSWRMALTWGGLGQRMGSSWLSSWRRWPFTIWQVSLLRFVFGALLLAMFAFFGLLLVLGFLLFLLLLAACVGSLGAVVWRVICWSGPRRITLVIPSAWGMVIQSVKSKDAWRKLKKDYI